MTILVTPVARRCRNLHTTLLRRLGSWTWSKGPCKDCKPASVLTSQELAKVLKLDSRSLQRIELEWAKLAKIVVWLLS